MKGISVLLFAIALIVVRAENECPPEQENDWAIEQLLRHEDCDKFYKCTFGQPIPYICPDNLYFNLDTWQCDWPENVDCTDRNDPADFTTTPEPTTTTTPEPTTTTTTTTTPAPTTTTTTTTTPAPTTTTTTTTTTTPAPTTTTTTTTPLPECEVNPKPEPEQEIDVDFLGNGCPADQHVHWLVPHEADCNLFYYCVRGERVLRECPSTLHFNPVIQVCDWPQSAGCAVSANKHLESRRLLQQILL